MEGQILGCQQRSSAGFPVGSGQAVRRGPRRRPAAYCSAPPSSAGPRPGSGPAGRTYPPSWASPRLLGRLALAVEGDKEGEAGEEEAAGRRLLTGPGLVGEAEGGLKNARVGAGAGLGGGLRVLQRPWMGEEEEELPGCRVWRGVGEEGQM